MRRLLTAAALLLAMASPAIAQEAPVPTPAPLPTVTVTAPAVPIKIEVDDESPTCSWRKPSTWIPCMSEGLKEKIQAGQAKRMEESIRGLTSFLRTPQPFSNDRVRTLWLYMALPVGIALVGILATWGAAKGVVGNPSHMGKGELGGRIAVAIAAASSTILAIPWLIDLSNYAAEKMAFVDLVSPAVRPSDSWLGVLDIVALCVLMVVLMVLLIVGLLRWLLIVLWCVGGPIPLSLITLPGTEDIAQTYLKGLGAMLLVPVVNTGLLSVAWWVAITGPGIFPITWGPWLDSLLIVVLALACLVVEAKALIIAFGIRNYSSLKRALRRGQGQTVVSIQSAGIRSADRWELGARERIGL